MKIPCGKLKCGTGEDGQLCFECQNGLSKFLCEFNTERIYLRQPQEGSWQCPGCGTWFGPKSLQACSCQRRSGRSD